MDMEMLTPTQKRIYEGLKNIGQALANFYLDGVYMAAPECTLLSKANMLAHAAREIDAGLRDTFAPKTLAEKKSSQISKKGKQGSGHLASILIAVGKDDPQNELANKWFAIATHFHSLAHRKRIHEGSADPTEITRLWTEYEIVLDIVIGSFLAITNRLDVLLGFTEPDPLALPALRNILNNPRHASYFFTKLNKPGWLIPLKENGFFDVKAASANSNETLTVERWWPISYLLAISKEVTGEEEAALSEIVDDLMRSYTIGEVNLHPFMVSDLLETVINLDRFSFGTAERSFVEKSASYDDGWDFVSFLLTERFAAKLIIKEDLIGLKNLLDYFFSFIRHEHPSFSFIGEEAEPYYENKPNVQQFHIKELLHRHGEAIIGMLGLDAIKVAIKSIEAIIQSGSYNLSRDNPRSIEETSQTLYNSNWEVELVYFIRDYAVKLKTDQLGILVDEMVDSKILVLQRLAIHFIRTHFGVFGDKWWHYVENTGAEDDIYIHEPYVLLREHSASFSDKQIEKVIVWIERVNSPKTDQDGTEGKRFAGARIRRWLTSLRPVLPRSKQLLIDKENYYRGWWDGKIGDHPEFDSYASTFIGLDYPLASVDFQNFSVAEQIAFIQSYQPEHPSDTSEEGLAELLQQNVANQPDKYLYSLTDFLQLHSLYLYRLVDGLSMALQKEKLYDFSLVLNFAESKLSVISIRGELEKKFYSLRWFAGSIGEFVKTIAFHYQRLGVDAGDVTRMIDLILSFINHPAIYDGIGERKEYVNDVLNSTIGRLYFTLIELTKLWADVFTLKEEPVRWPLAVNAHFTELIRSHAAKDRDFSTILGMHFELLLFLDKAWVEANAAIIFDEGNLEHFGYRLEAALISTSHLPEPIYRFFKEHQLFRKSLKHLRQQSSALNTLMGYALLEWKHWGGKPDEDGILADVFREKDHEQIKQLVRTIFERRLLSHEEIIYVWEQLISVIETTPGLFELYPMLLWLFERLSKLDERSFVLATVVIAKSKSGREIYSFLRHLYQIAGDHIEMAGKLVVQIYQAKLVTPYSETELSELVKKLYANGHKLLADDICILVTEQNSMALKDIYNQYN